MLEYCERFPKEQKGCCKGTRGTDDLLYIDQHILKAAKKMHKNVDMVWIDGKKAYDMVLQIWITKCLKMYKISDKVINFIMKPMENGKVKLATGG